MKLYIESKIKPTKINKTIVKLLLKQYPLLKTVEFFKTKITSTNDTIYILDFDDIDLIDIDNQTSYFKIGNTEYKGLTISKINNEYHINSDHWKTEELKKKREIIALDNKTFNTEIDNAVDRTKEIIDKLEYRIKKLRKIDWKV